MGKKQKTVLVGGCFDILHPGHLVFLEKAKKQGDFLIVLLESDQKVKKLKGKNRPINTQEFRAKALSKLKSVDLVLPLPYMETPKEYDDLIAKIAPDVIATTKGYPQMEYLKRSADKVGAKLKEVTSLMGNHSTSSLLRS